MNNTIQLYMDEKQEIKGYPITSPDRVIDENGVNIKVQLDNNTSDINLLKDNKINYTDKLNIITPEMFGVKCDGTDETEKIQECINYAIENKLKVEFRNGKEYCFNKLLIHKPCAIDFNNAVLRNTVIDSSSSLIEIGREKDSFETKTEYSSKFNISNINIHLNNKFRKYGLEIHARHININRIVVREAVNHGVYLGDNDGVWIEQILCFGDNENTNANGVTIGCNDIILGNVECAYFKNGVYVDGAFNDIEIDKLHVWSDVEGCKAIKYNGNSYYGHINSLIIDCVYCGIDLTGVDGYGKLNIDNIMVFPSEKFTDWQILKQNFNFQSMGITIGYIYGIGDTDTTLRLKDFQGTIRSLNNYNQKPKIYCEYSNISGSGHNFEQINGLWYQTTWSKITISNTNSTKLGKTNTLNKLWVGLAVPVCIVGGDYAPVNTNGIIFIGEDGFTLRTSTTLNGTYNIKITCGLPSGYSY